MKKKGKKNSGKKHNKKTKELNSKKTNPLQITLIITIILLILGIAIILATITPMNNESDTEINSSNTREIELSQITVNNQDPGNSIMIENIQLSERGYVVIHEDDNGSPGNVIGHSGLLSGNISNVIIPLERLASNEMLHAMLHVDDGDYQYEFPGDDSPLKQNGEIVVESFEVS